MGAVMRRARTCSLGRAGSLIVLIAVLCLLAGEVGVGAGSARADQGESAVRRVAASITAGESHTCALSTNGKVRCWGTGANGELGHGNPFAVGDGGTTIRTAGDISVGRSVRVRATTHLSARVGPARNHRAAYVYRVTGHLGGPFVPDAATCTGRVSLTVRHGHHLLRRHSVGLRPDCHYRFRIRLPATQLPADHPAKLTFALRYRGTGNLAPAATTTHVRAR